MKLRYISETCIMVLRCTNDQNLYYLHITLAVAFMNAAAFGFFELSRTYVKDYIIVTEMLSDVT